MVLQFGRWHPDAPGLDNPVLTQAINCVPNAAGFRPLLSPAAVSNPLDDRCYGAVTVLKLDSRPASYAGTQTALYLLQADNAWLDRTWATGPYNTADDGRWRFTQFGDLLIATNFSDPVQKTSIAGGTQFEALGGNPPNARYIDTVRDFVLLGCLEGQEDTVQWSGLNNAEQWTPGLEFSDFQTFPQGGPITGVLGGEVGYIFQRERVYRMTYVPGSEFVFQFDEVESGRGLAYPNSLVKLGNTAYYMSDDGLYQMDLASGSARPIGVGKFHEYMQDNVKKGAERFVYGAFSPQNDAILWAYPEAGAADVTTPNRVLWYNHHIDEASEAQLSIVAVSPWLTQGFTMDTMDAVVALGAETISNAVDNGSGLIRLTIGSTARYTTGETRTVEGVQGTTEANGDWVITVIDGTTIDLQGSTFTNAYTSGGYVTSTIDELPAPLDSAFYKEDEEDGIKKMGTS